jgi:NADH-quinone oxidoreductase subunit C
MTDISLSLVERLRAVFDQRLREPVVTNSEVTIVFGAADLTETMTRLRDSEGLQFELLVDLCGVDYSTFGEGGYEGPRFAVVYHLLSIALNQRLRVRVFCDDDEMPRVASVIDIWPGRTGSSARLSISSGSSSRAIPTCGAS